jgi:hypothetical protein
MTCAGVGSLLLMKLSMPSSVDVMLLFSFSNGASPCPLSEELSPSSEPEQLTRIGA